MSGTVNGNQALTLDPRVVEEVVAAAILAPSVLNCQPWTFQAYADVIDVHVDRTQLPTRWDPLGREVLLSVGAALLNLRLALEAESLRGTVRLLPSPDERTLAARVRVGPGRPLGGDERALFEALPRRRANRLPFEDREVPYSTFLELSEAARHEGEHLEALNGLQRQVVVQALHEADREQRADPQVVEEARRWTGDQRAAGTGIPDESLGPIPHDPASPVRDMALGTVREGRSTAAFESAPLLAVLMTTGDAPVDWLRGGLALERVLLTATALGLEVGLLSHAGEVPYLRAFTRDPLSSWHHPQLVLRIGYGTPMPPTPRRTLAEVLAFGAP